MHVCSCELSCKFEEKIAGKARGLTYVLLEMVKKCTELPCGFDMFAAGLRVLLSQKIGIENQKMSSESQLALAE